MTRCISPLTAGALMLCLGALSADAQDSKVDMAKMMKDSAKAPHKVPLHEDVRTGQWAQYTDSAGSPLMWWGITGKKGKSLIVEMRMKTGLNYVTYGYVCDSKGVVSEAYIANFDPKGKPQVAYKIKVSEPPAKTVPKGDAPKPKTGQEDIKAAGTVWKTTWTEVQAGEKLAKTWMASTGWFNKIIKSEWGGKVTIQLKDIGTGAKQGFKFPN